MTVVVIDTARAWQCRAHRKRCAGFYTQRPLCRCLRRARTHLTARGWRGPGTRQEQAQQELVCTLERFVVPRGDLKAVAIVQGPALSLLGCQLLVNLQQHTRFTVDGAST